MRWARDAIIAKGHVPPSAGEMLSAEQAVTDGTPDTSQEYRAAGKASGSQWTVTGRIDRHDAPPARLPDGTEEEGYTTYRVELEVCQVETGRVESLAREIDPDEAPAQLAEMLGLLLRPGGDQERRAPLGQRGAPQAQGEAEAEGASASASAPAASSGPRPSRS